MLLLLHEGEATWPGRLHSARDTMALSALSINTAAQRSPKVWGAQRLPSDACRAVPVPAGGVLVLSKNMISYHSQARRAAKR